jgi:hypothetical protein
LAITYAEMAGWSDWICNFTGGGGIFNDGGTVTLTNSVIDGDCSGVITSNGHNIESPGNTCGLDQPTDQVDVTEEDLNLGPLANNRGPTLTHKPGAGGFGFDSAAIDKIPEAECEVETDQRGERRPSGVGCDVGSVEVGPAL